MILPPRQLADVMKLPLHQRDLKDAAVLDYYTAALWWGKEQAYTTEQLSALFTVVHTLLENVRGTQSNIFILADTFWSHFPN